MKDIKNTVEFLPEWIQEIFNKISRDILEDITEIRIRKDCPISIKCKGKIFFVDEKGNMYYKPGIILPTVKNDDIDFSFKRLCDFSVYSHLDDIKKGYITLKTGDRVGFCGSAVRDNDSVVAIKNITSFNIRIARQFIGASDEIFSIIKKNGFGNILIAGEPLSGKTTVLRDLAKNLSMENMNVCVIDERQELFGNNTDFEKGSCMDVFCSYPKNDAIQTALRTMSPDYIVTDEIGEESECRAIIKALNSGVKFALTIHCPNYNQLINKEIFIQIEKVQKFDYIIFLKGKEKTGQIADIIYNKEQL